MSILMLLWYHLIFLLSKDDAFPQDLYAMPELGYKIPPSEIYKAKHIGHFVYTVYPNIKEYCRELEYFIDAITRHKLVKKDSIQVSVKKLAVQEFFVDSDGYLVNPEKNFLKFLSLVQEFESSFIMAQNLDKQYLVDTDLAVTIRWLQPTLLNSINICRIFLKEVYDTEHT